MGQGTEVKTRPDPKVEIQVYQSINPLFVIATKIGGVLKKD